MNLHIKITHMKACAGQGLSFNTKAHPFVQSKKQELQGSSAKVQTFAPRVWHGQSMADRFAPDSGLRLGLSRVLKIVGQDLCQLLTA